MDLHEIWHTVLSSKCYQPCQFLAISQRGRGSARGQISPFSADLGCCY